MTDSLYTRDGDFFVPGERTRGPWSPDAQHGGPPAALLAGEMEAVETRVPMQTVRLTIELHRPVPLQPLRVETRALRMGKRIALIGASLLHDNTEVAAATALRIRIDDLPVPAAEPTGTDPLPPEAGHAGEWTSHWPDGYHNIGVEHRVVEGGFHEAGPGCTWVRLLQPVVDDDPISPVQRVAGAADFGNGISAYLRSHAFIYINPDLTIYLHREPVDEWVAVRAHTTANPSGIGLASSTLYDVHGPIGTGSQSLYVAPVS